MVADSSLITSPDEADHGRSAILPLLWGPLSACQLLVAEAPGLSKPAWQLHVCLQQLLCRWGVIWEPWQPRHNKQKQSLKFS